MKGNEEDETAGLARKACNDLPLVFLFRVNMLSLWLIEETETIVKFIVQLHVTGVWYYVERQQCQERVRGFKCE